LLRILEQDGATGLRGLPVTLAIVCIGGADGTGLGVGTWLRGRWRLRSFLFGLLGLVLMEPALEEGVTIAEARQLARLAWLVVTQGVFFHMACAALRIDNAHARQVAFLRLRLQPICDASASPAEYPRGVPPAAAHWPVRSRLRSANISESLFLTPKALMRKAWSRGSALQEYRRALLHPTPKVL